MGQGLDESPRHSLLERLRHDMASKKTKTHTMPGGKKMGGKSHGEPDADDKKRGKKGCK